MIRDFLCFHYARGIRALVDKGVEMPLELATNDRHLRAELDKITDLYVCDRVGEQIGQISKLAQKYPHSISLAAEAVPDRPDTFQFNCYQYSFGLLGLDAVDRIMRKHRNVYPGREFIQFLIETRLHEISFQETEPGDHIVYASDSQIEHAGKVRGETIESKWGLMHLWRHRVFEVPWRYGNRVRIFRGITQEDSVRAFLDFANVRYGVHE